MSEDYEQHRRESEPVGESNLSGLIAAITAQTEAINALAASNMALVDAMLADEEDGDGKPSQTYLSDPGLR